MEKCWIKSFFILILLTVAVILSRPVLVLPVPGLFYASAMIRNDNGFMSVCVLQFYMGAILAGNRKTVS